MPVHASGDTLSLNPSESIISKSLNKILKGSNETSLDSSIKSVHHSSILNCPLKFKLSEQTNITSISNLNQRYTPLQNGTVSRNSNPEAKDINTEGMKKEKDEDGIPTPKIMISQVSDVKLTWSRITRVGCGLKNLGNSCFMNAVLQCLTYLPSLANALVENNHSSQCFNKGFCTLCEVQKHMYRVMNAPEQSISPTFFFHNLNKIGHFIKFKQEDAHEFLRYLLCHMEKSALDSFKSRHSINVDAASSRTTIVNSIFGGYNRSQVICLKCKETSNTYDPFMDTMLDIKLTDSLDGALVKYIQPETLEGDNAYKCQRCKCRVPAQKRVTIHRAPSVCTFHLKRFQYNNAFGSKIGKWIRFPEKLNLRPYMSESKRPPVLYVLRGIVVHSGQSMQSGHYYAYIRNAKGNFYYMNDDLVSAVDKNKVFSQNAYILFYSKIPQVQKQNESPKINGVSVINSPLRKETQLSTKPHTNIPHKQSSQVNNNTQVSAPSSKENIIHHVNKSHKSSKHPRIVLKIKNGRVNSLDENSKCGLVPYAEDSDIGSDQENLHVNGTKLSVNREISSTNLKGHNPTKVPGNTSCGLAASSVNGTTEKQKTESKEAKCSSPVVSSKMLLLTLNVDAPSSSTSSPKKIATLTHPLPQTFLQSPSRLNSSGNWSVTENKNQESSVASSTSSANSAISSVDNWTVSDQVKDGHKIEKRAYAGWTVSSSKRASKLEPSATFPMENYGTVNGPVNSEQSVSEPAKKCNKNNFNVSKNVSKSSEKDGGPTMSESRCYNFLSEAKDTISSRPVDKESGDGSDSDDSECSYEVEWVERTKETIEQDKALESKEKEKFNNVNVFRQDKSVKLHNGFRENEHLENKHIYKKSSHTGEYFGSSIQSYGSSVKSWNGNASEINLEIEREKRLKRWTTDDYNEEFDRGKVKKMKYNNVHNEKKYKFTGSFLTAYNHQKFSHNHYSGSHHKRYQHHHRNNNYHHRQNSFHGKSFHNRGNGFRRHSYHNSDTWRGR